MDTAGKWLRIDLGKEEMVTGVYVVTNPNYFIYSSDDWFVWVSNAPTIEDTIADESNKCVSEQNIGIAGVGGTSNCPSMLG